MIYHIFKHYIHFVLINLGINKRSGDARKTLQRISEKNENRDRTFSKNAQAR